MNFKNILIIAVVIGIIYTAWFISAPKKIVDIHKNGDAYFILLKNPPIFDSTKIKWWKEHREYFNKKYKIPEDKPGSYIMVLDFGKGYRTYPSDYRIGFVAPSDYICFDDMNTKVNCIYKEWAISLSKKPSGDIHISTGNDEGSKYIQKPDGLIIKAGK